MPQIKDKTMAQKRFSKAFKANVVLEALRDHKNTAQLSSQYGVYATQISAWKKQALDSLPETFANKLRHGARDCQAREDRLYRQVGKLQVELALRPIYTRHYCIYLDYMSLFH